MGKGICVAGNMTVDKLYPISGWPHIGELQHIHEGLKRTTGGAVCNVAIDLAKLDPSMPVYAMGRIGSDEEASFILDRIHEQKNIDTSNIICDGISSFTLVMNDQISKQRTFFTYSGASGRFCEEDIDWDRLDCDIFHIGYVLLMDALDQPDAEYGSKMARMLHRFRERGIRTSIDVVSEAGNRFKTLVPPALKYTDICAINELEAEQSTGVKLRDENGALIEENMPKALQTMKDMGVSTWAVIHCPEGGYGLDENDAFVKRASLRLPDGFIKGTVGAGDAFCAGILYGAEKHKHLGEAIELGIAAAACSLSEESSTDGVRTEAEAWELYRKLR